MAMLPNNLVKETDNYDVDVIQGLNVNSQEFKEFLVRLRQEINEIRISLNARDGGYRVLGEFNTGMQYYPNAAVPTMYRTINCCTVNFGALPNAGTTLVNHNINPGTGTTANYFFIGWDAMANNTGALTYLTIPYNDGTNIISLSVTQTQVSITTNFNASAYTTDVTLYYIVN